MLKNAKSIIPALFKMNDLRVIKRAKTETDSRIPAKLIEKLPWPITCLILFYCSIDVPHEPRGSQTRSFNRILATNTKCMTKIRVQGIWIMLECCQKSSFMQFCLCKGHRDISRLSHLHDPLFLFHSFFKKG